MQEIDALNGANQQETRDLGPLAWVLDELRRSLDGAIKALRRFVRDAELARGSDLAALDASQLRIARQQLHQAVGALEMVGMAEPAKVLRAMEALAQRFVQRPEICNMEAANKVELASFALIEYLQAVLKGKDVSPVALFPQYRALLQQVGDERIHPADLWPLELRWIDFEVPQEGPVHEYDAAIRARLDGLILKVVKSADQQAAKSMRAICLGFAAAQTQLQARIFWKICAGYFESVSLGLCAPDVYGKRAASQILLQYRTLARGEPAISERLVQDLLFFCAQVNVKSSADAPVLAAIRAAYGLAQSGSVDYETARFGQFDPALLVQARKRIAAATETWSALAGGDTNRLKVASDQFALVGDSVQKLHPQSGDLVRALTQAIENTARSGEAPASAIAMEVATVVLYLEAAFDDLDPSDPRLAERSASLARRLEHVNTGGQPEPLESWMEELYRRVSDRQIMGSVVGELRVTLGGVEKSLDSFFRNPLDKLPLHEVPSQLAQMRGVFSVLGLDQAALATLRMRDSVEKFLIDDVDPQSGRQGVFEKLGNSLGALGFLIDMLSYQRALAKSLFVYDEEAGEFKPMMGREKTSARVSVPDPVSDSVVATVNTVAVQAPLAPVQPPSSALKKQPDPVDEDDAELKDIFLQEAREVVQIGVEAVKALAGEPADMMQQTTLRRAFHTLKGSSRMVGLVEFGEAAWSMEQVLNSWLAEQKPASDELILLSGKAVHGLSRWVEDIASGDDAKWSAQVFRTAADAMRLHHQHVELVLVGDVAEVAAPQDSELHDFEATQIFDASGDGAQGAQASSTTGGTPGADEVTPLGLDDFDFGSTPVNIPAPEVQTPAVELEPAAPEPSPVPVPPEEVLTEAQVTHAPEPELQEQVKVVGSLQIDIALYSVYLSEADELSRRLLTELSEWALELHRPVADTTIALAHSLTGCSATVGFVALSELARGLEQTLQHVQLHAQSRAQDLSVFVEVAEEIRRLLHQFAAGFLKECDPALLDALRAILETQFSPLMAAVAESSPEPVPEPTLEPVPEPTLEPVPEPILEPVPEPTLEPVPEPTLEPVPEPILEPVPEVTDEVQAEAVPLTQETQATDQPDAEFDAVCRIPESAIDSDNLAFVARESAQTSTELPPSLLAEPLKDPLQDLLDVDLFPVFVEEALELLPQLGGALRQWVESPDQLAARSEALRALHTLKGSGRLAGALHLGEMAHRMESSIEQIGIEASAQALEPLLHHFDAIQVEFDRLRETPEQVLSLPEASTTVSAELAEQPVPQPTLADAEPVPERRHSKERVSRQASVQTVRVRAPLLDRLVNQAGEVMITRSRLESRLGQLRGSLSDLSANLNRLRQQLRDLELQSESQMQSRLAQTKDSAQGFDPLEFDRFTRVQELTRMMAESVSDVATVQRNLQRAVEGSEDDLIAQGRQARELQRDLLRTRMVEFDSISERLYGLVRKTAKDVDKQVKLDIQGGSLDMDRGVLDRMTPVFEHLLRNAVAHGIEDAALRSAVGKPDVGNITISLQQQGNDVTLEFQDDGIGLDLERIRQKALASGQVRAGEVLTDAEATNLIFVPGFSTAQQVTELAGRGIGLDVVRAEVNALGGHIELTTQHGQGARFKLVLPLTTAVTHVVMLRIGNLMIGVAANLVEMVRRVPVTDAERAYQNKFFEFGGERVPFFWAGALLQTSGSSSEAAGKTLPVVIFRSAGQRVAAHVDEVLGNQEVVVKNLGPQLSRLPGLTGLSVLASGAVVLLYNPVALASVYGEQARQLGLRAEPGVSALATQTPQLTGIAQAPLVLVVDDSITVRRVTQRLLKREGFRVVLANDGLQALERLQEEKPSVVLTDIEMPRMDGFDLVRNIRADARLQDLPVIMITSRIAEKHREHAVELGVDHYLGKPYSEEELIGLVRGYCTTPVELA